VYIGKNEKWSLVPNSKVSYPEEEALDVEWKAFLKSIKENKPSPIPGQYGEQMLRIIEAAKWSSKTQKEYIVSERKQTNFIK
jgi:hypothetical protein